MRCKYDRQQGSSRLTLYNMRSYSTDIATADEPSEPLVESFAQSLSLIGGRSTRPSSPFYYHHHRTPAPQQQHRKHRPGHPCTPLLHPSSLLPLARGDAAVPPTPLARALDRLGLHLVRHSSTTQRISIRSNTTNSQLPTSSTTNFTSFGSCRPSTLFSSSPFLTPRSSSSSTRLDPHLSVQCTFFHLFHFIFFIFSSTRNDSRRLDLVPARARHHGRRSCSRSETRNGTMGLDFA